MNFYEALLMACLVIAAVSFLVLLLTRMLSQSAKADTESRGYRISWMETIIQQQITDSRLALREERNHNQTLLNILLSKDLPTMAAMQSATLNQPSTVILPTRSEHIPRDDVSEFLRAMNFSGNPGLGQVIIDPDADPEFNQVIGEMMGENNLNFAEDGG